MDLVVVAAIVTECCLSPIVLACGKQASGVGSGLGRLDVYYTEDCSETGMPVLICMCSARLFVYLRLSYDISNTYLNLPGFVLFLRPGLFRSGYIQRSILVLDKSRDYTPIWQ